MQNKPALLLSLMLACTAAGAEPLNYNIVEFDESVSATVPRDTMTASFVIRAEGRDRSAVNRAFTAKLQSFSPRAERKTFETAQFGRTAVPTYEYRNNKRILTGWQESVEFSVESKDFAALNRLIADSQAEAEVQNTSFSLSKQKQKETVDELSRTALHRFRERAADLGKALGFSGYKIVKLRINESGSPSAVMAKSFAEGRYAAAPEALSAPAAPDLPVSPGSEKIRVTVSGSIQM